MNALRSLIIQSIQSDQSPRALMARIGIDESLIPAEASDSDLWLELFRILEHSRFPIRRTYIKSMDEVMEKIRNANNIVAVIGAGASVGPDFRSPGGLYDQIARSGALEDPYKVFDMEYFTQDPSVFWKFAHLIFPSTDPEHSQTHYFLAELEKKGKLLRVYSQNVDTLEVGIPNEKLRCVHGSWRENKCMSCGTVHTIEDLRECVNNKEVPACKQCGAHIKPGIVFFGQKTNMEDEDIEYDSEHADLLIVVGTSLRVAPVSFIPEIMHKVPSILINREPVSCEFNAELLGDCDDVVMAIENDLGWTNNESKNNEKNKGKTSKDFVFVQPNKFVLPTEDGVGVQFSETGRSIFLVTPTLSGGHTFE